MNESPRAKSSATFAAAGRALAGGVAGAVTPGKLDLSSTGDTVAGGVSVASRAVDVSVGAALLRSAPIAALTGATPAGSLFSGIGASRAAGLCARGATGRGAAAAEGGNSALIGTTTSVPRSRVPEPPTICSAFCASKEKPMPKKTPSKLSFAPRSPSLTSATSALVAPLRMPPPKPIANTHN